jgi:hypothetical protein
MKRLMSALAGAWLAVSAATAATTDFTDLASFLGVPVSEFDDIATAVGGTNFAATAISQNITANPGTGFSFDWAMVSDEEGELPDYVFYSISSAESTEVHLLADAVNATFSASLTPFIEDTGFANESTLFAGSGSGHTIGFGVVSVDDGEFASGLLLDNIGFAEGNGANLGFEAGSFGGWSTYGDPQQSIETSAFGLGPTEGTYQAFLTVPDAGPAVPEPGTMVLFGLASAGLFAARRRGRRQQQG